MAETTDPANSLGESPYKAGEQNGQPTAEPAAEPTFEMSKPAAEPTLPAAADLTLPPIDISLPAMDNSLPHIDKTFPSIGSTKLPPIDHSSLPSLPPIDTTLPPLDTTLPAVESGLPAIDTNFSFPDTRTTNIESSGPSSTIPASGAPENNTFNQTGSSAPGPSYQSSSNGTYPQQPVQQQQQQPSESHYQQQHQPPQQYASPHQHSQLPQQQTQSQPQQPQQYQQQNSEMYHNSNSSTSMNAPSMQTMDHHHMQGQSSHIPQAPIGSPMPSNMPPMAGQYMTGYPTSVAQMGMNSNAQMRYQLPGDPNKMLSGGRHKKEVKRRTKTGCLTCRKRRIKCDEGHPVCRNCVKSKRECLGYDPVFKSPQAPSAIQPAPNPPPSLVVNPQDPTPSYPAAPPGYMPAASQPFAPSLHSESPSTSTEQQHYDYGAPIDPSLDENNSPNMASVQSATEGGLQPPVNPSMNATTTPSEPSNFRVKQVQVNDLLALRGIPPPPPHPVTTLAPNRLEEIQAVFLATYAPAIDKFFETRWFSEKALTHLLANAQLMAEYSALIDAFNDRNLSDPNVVARLESFEASVVWSSVTLCRHVRNASSGTQDYDLLSSSARLDVIEAMITGEYLESNPLAQFPTREPAANPPSLPDQLTQRSLDFWSAVGHFLTLHDNEASSAKEIDDTLARCRTLLDTYENRDVIYSIAIARHVGQRWADFPRSLPQPITTNEKDAGAKLYVAQKFLEEEAGGKGTTQVIRRICGMVVRSWIVSRE